MSKNARYIYLTGAIRSKQQVRVASGHSFQSKPYRSMEKSMKLQVKEQWPYTPIDKDIDLDVYINIYEPMPKAWSKKMKVEMVGKKARRPLDLDNAAKSIIDQLNGIVFADDNAIVSLSINRIWYEGSETSTTIAVMEL